jgi:hypothetical protein
VAGPPGEIVARGAFKAGQMVQKTLPCGGGTLEDCVTNAWFDASQTAPPTFDEFGVRDPNIKVMSDGSTVVAPPAPQIPILLNSQNASGPHSGPDTRSNATAISSFNSAPSKGTVDTPTLSTPTPRSSCVPTPGRNCSSK